MLVPNRVAVYLVAIAGLLTALAPAVADLDWTSTAGVLGGGALILGIASKWLEGWQNHENRTLPWAGQQVDEADDVIERDEDSKLSEIVGEHAGPGDLAVAHVTGTDRYLLVRGKVQFAVSSDELEMVENIAQQERLRKAGPVSEPGGKASDLEAMLSRVFGPPPEQIPDDDEFDDEDEGPADEMPPLGAELARAGDPKFAPLGPATPDEGNADDIEGDERKGIA